MFNISCLLQLILFVMYFLESNLKHMGETLVACPTHIILHKKQKFVSLLAVLNTKYKSKCDCRSSGRFEDVPWDTWMCSTRVCLYRIPRLGLQRSTMYSSTSRTVRTGPVDGRGAVSAETPHLVIPGVAHACRVLNSGAFHVWFAFPCTPWTDSNLTRLPEL